MHRLAAHVLVLGIAGALAIAPGCGDRDRDDRADTGGFEKPSRPGASGPGTDADDAEADPEAWLLRALCRVYTIEAGREKLTRDALGLVGATPRQRARAQTYLEDTRDLFCASMALPRRVPSLALYYRLLEQIDAAFLAGAGRSSPDGFEPTHDVLDLATRHYERVCETLTGWLGWTDAQFAASAGGAMHGRCAGSGHERTFGATFGLPARGARARGFRSCALDFAALADDCGPLAGDEGEPEKIYVREYEDGTASYVIEKDGAVVEYGVCTTGPPMSCTSWDQDDDRTVRILEEVEAGTIVLDPIELTIPKQEDEKQCTPHRPAAGLASSFLVANVAHADFPNVPPGERGPPTLFDALNACLCGLVGVDAAARGNLACPSAEDETAWACLTEGELGPDDRPVRDCDLALERDSHEWGRRFAGCEDVECPEGTVLSVVTTPLLSAAWAPGDDGRTCACVPPAVMFAPGGGACDEIECEAGRYCHDGACVPLGGLVLPPQICAPPTTGGGQLFADLPRCGEGGDGGGGGGGPTPGGEGGGGGGPDSPSG